MIIRNTYRSSPHFGAAVLVQKHCLPTLLLGGNMVPRAPQYRTIMLNLHMAEILRIIPAHLKSAVHYSSWQVENTNLIHTFQRFPHINMNIVYYGFSNPKLAHTVADLVQIFTADYTANIVAKVKSLVSLQHNRHVRVCSYGRATDQKI